MCGGRIAMRGGRVVMRGGKVAMRGGKGLEAADTISATPAEAIATLDSAGEV